MLTPVSAEPSGVCVLSCFSRVQLCASLFTAARQAPLSMGILQARIRDGLPYPSPRNLPDLGIEARSPAFQADSLPSKSPGRPPRNLLEWLFILATMEMYGSCLLSRENLLWGALSAGSLLLQPLWGALSFPTPGMLFGSWVFLASIRPLGSLCAQLSPSSYLSLFHKWAKPHGLEAFSAICSHFPVSFRGMILNTFHIPDFVLTFDSQRTKPMQMSISPCYVSLWWTKLATFHVACFSMIH